MLETQNQKYEKDLLSLADNMASAAASFSSHGYDSFIYAREELKRMIHTTVSQIKT